jgi:internalin A
MVWRTKTPGQTPAEDELDPGEVEALRRIAKVRSEGSRELDLSNLALKALPETIGDLAKIETLWASENTIQKLPECIGQLTRLEKLDLRRNQIEYLPETIGGLLSLEELLLSENRLTVLPDSIGHLSRLRKLTLLDNALRSLPDRMRNLSALTILLLQGNDALELPEEVMGPVSEWQPRNPAEILEYYFATRGVEGEALREVKLIFVGRGGAGKTSLIKRLKSEPFDRQETETHGITIRPLELECSDGLVQAHVWDFGGQHVLHAMHEFFLTARSLYVLVLGEREDMAERDATYWLQLIRSYAGPAPVVVALNKSSGRPREMDRRTLEEKYGPIMGWVATECSDPDDEASGISDLRDALAATTDGMDDVRRRFPVKWFRIKDWLSSMAEAYVEYDEYERRCTTLGEPDPQKQEELAGWLHDLGIALNYGRDPRLRDTTILRPEWLANGIFAVLRANDPRHERPLAPDGVVTPDSLGYIYPAADRLGMLSAVDYPEEKWLFLLRLMSLFQLSFPMDETGHRQLVPTLLPVEEPAEALEPQGENRVRLRYEFSVVPAPLIPRFLVRTFGLVPKKIHWRRGALLHYGPASAKIWSTQDERWVYLTIDGDDEGARDDLTVMLRGTLHELFGEYRNLDVTEQMEWKGEWVPRATLEKLGMVATEKEALFSPEARVR